MQILRRFIRDEKGSPVIEFALVAPLFFFLIFAIIEMSLIFFSAVTIEDATLNVVRQAKLGNAQAQADPVKFVKDYIRSHAYGLIDPKKLFITTSLQPLSTGSSYSETASEQCQPTINDPLQPCPCGPGAIIQDTNGNGLCDMGPPPLSLGGPGDIIQFKVVYSWKTLVPGVKQLLGGGPGGVVGDAGGNFLIQSGVAIRNEPF